MYIRRARISDSDKLADLISTMAKDNKFWKDMDMDLEVVKDEIFDVLILGTMSTVIFVAEQDEELIGLLVADIFHCQYDGEKRGEERNWFVHPKHRGGMAAKKLFDMAMDWWKEKGVDRIKVGHFHGNSQAERFYKRLGFKPYTKHYLMEMKD